MTSPNIHSDHNRFENQFSQPRLVLFGVDDIQSTNLS
jgi:hypothetical protein